MGKPQCGSMEATIEILLRPFAHQTNVTSSKSSVRVVLVLVVVNLCISSSSSKLFVCLDIVLVLVLNCRFMI